MPEQILLLCDECNSSRNTAAFVIRDGEGDERKLILCRPHARPFERYLEMATLVVAPAAPASRAGRGLSDARLDSLHVG